MNNITNGKNNSAQQDLDSVLDIPYPLKQKFMAVILPIFVMISLVIAVIIGQGSSLLTEKIYLKISENRSAIIDRALNAEAPDAWAQLQTTTQPQQVFQAAGGAILLESLREELKELGLSHLKIYGKNALLLYSSNEEQIGTHDPSQAYRDAVTGKRSLVEKQTDEGLLYELYVKVPNSANDTIIELYEPVDHLNGITRSVMIPATSLLLAILILLGWLMKKLVFHAQNDINYRTNLIFDYRNRLQQLVSHEAVFTATGDTVNIASRLCTAAKQNEIVIDSASCLAAQIEETGTEELWVKGKEKTIAVCRMVIS